MLSTDIFDVLSIQPKPSSPNSQVGQTSTTSAKYTKPQVTGMQRELYNLLGDNLPPAVVTTGNKFKDKLNFISKPSPWTYAKFEATPYLKLEHWVKGSKELLKDDPQKNVFAKFNQHLIIPDFTENGFNEFMQQADNDKSETPTGNKEIYDWSYDEVKYLFDLCRKYDMRWYVILDRYNYKENRTLEDLKEMFYTVYRRYLEKNEKNNPLLEKLTYNKSTEIERKKYLTRLLSRSAAEVAEEEALIMESRKFEMSAKKTLQEREALLRLLDHPQSDNNINHSLTSQGINRLYNNLLNDKQRRRKPDATPSENPWMKQHQHFSQQKQQQMQQQQSIQSIEQKRVEFKENSNNVSSPVASSPSTRPADQLAIPKMNKKQKLEMQTAIRRKQDSEYAKHLLRNFTTEEQEAMGITLHGDKLPPGVYLRSFKISTYKPAIQNKVASILQELGLPLRPTMPSAKVVQQHEELLKRIIMVLDLKRQLDKLEAENYINS